MRTRARTSNTTLPAGFERREWLTNNPGYVEIAGSGGPSTYQSLEETITDEQPKLKHSGACVHSKTRTWYADCKNMAFGPWWSGSPPTYMSTLHGDYIYRNVILPNATSLALGSFLMPGSFDWKVASYNAIKQMREDIKTLLFPNFISELAETVRTARENADRRIDTLEARVAKQKRLEVRKGKAKEKLRYIAKVTGKSQSALARGLRDPKVLLGQLRGLLKTSIGAVQKAGKSIAMANLAWQFAFRPTVDDARKLVDLIANYDTRISKLIEDAGKLRVKHYSRPVDALVTLPSALRYTLGTFFGLSPHYVDKRHEWLTRPKYHATLLYSYDASALKGCLGKIRGMVHALGVDRIGSILWEALPYSFVVDWFVNIGDIISEVEDLFLDPLPIVIHDFNHSLKYGYRTRLDWQPGTRCRTDIGTRTFEYYERRRDIPSLFDSLQVRSPNLNQAGLGLSLLVVKMDGNTKWRPR